MAGLFVISGSSGVGKGTVIKEFLKNIRISSSLYPVLQEV